MAEHHARAREAHDVDNGFSPLRLITMDLTVGAGCFFLSERATIQALIGIV